MNNLAAIRKCTIVQNTDLKAQEITTLSTEWTTKAEANSYSIVHATSPLLPSSLVPCLTVSCGSASYANR